MPAYTDTTDTEYSRCRIYYYLYVFWIGCQYTQWSKYSTQTIPYVHRKENISFIKQCNGEISRQGKALQVAQACSTNEIE